MPWAGELIMRQSPQEPQGPQGPWARGPPGHMMAGMRWRSVASIVIGFGWVLFILLFAGLWSASFSLFQNIVIFFASIVFALGILAAMWAGWGMRWGPWAQWGRWGH
jgi:hypothetical protein